MVSLIIENCTTEELMKICDGLAGWKPYVDSDVVVHDSVIDDKTNQQLPKMGIIIGPENGNDVEFKVQIQR